ncbi:MAG: FAD-dependent oxidoreductase [Phycisphaeraceae bacterium]
MTAPALPRQLSFDVAVIGAGAAGLYTSLVAAECGANVALVSSSPLPQSASYWAQGGLAAAIGPDDDTELHLRDTIAAGRGATASSRARILCDEAPERLRELEQRGMQFDADETGALMLGLEGGHSRRRIVHAGGSATGRYITVQLADLVAAHERITVFERCSASRLWVVDDRCAGLASDAGPIGAATTVLAAGGGAAMWQRTTNPRGAVGAGMRLGLDAGAELADLEFCQFHPTALSLEGELDGFLITEAVRGEGAKLVTSAGERFVDELAPRDEVARAIGERLRDSGEDHVLLDMRSLDPARFPNIYEELAGAGIDPTRQPIPVSPAAHYTIGGIATDEHARSSLRGLYAVGESASTGVHGANRLASNSLSECFVFGRRAALAAAAEPASQRPDPASAPSGAVAMQPSEEVRRSLWNHAGLLRDEQGLRQLAQSPDVVARMIGATALRRRESRGCHLRFDFPERDPAMDGRHLVVGRSEEPSLVPWD